jgi:LacI family transcriptional regulator
MNFDVPEQLAIAGFEDSPFSRQTWPKLTTAAQPTNIIARQATASLVSHIAAKRKKATSNSEISHQHFQPKLVIRESTSKKLS